MARAVSQPLFDKGSEKLQIRQHKHKQLQKVHSIKLASGANADQEACLNGLYMLFTYPVLVCLGIAACPAH